MAGEDVVNGGTASVEIEAVIKLNEASVAEAKAKLASELGQSDVSTTEGRRGRRAGGSTPTTATVDAKVKTKIEGTLSKDVQAALAKDEYTLRINVANIRQQIQTALEKPFDIVLNADIKGALAASPAAGLAHAATAVETRTRGEAPPELNRYVKRFGDTIDALHQQLTEASAALGKTFGRVGAAGSSLDKAADVLEHFGATDFSGLLEIQKTAKLPKVAGGALSSTSLQSNEHFSPSQSKAIENLARGFTSGAGGEFKQTDAQVFFKRLGEWMGTHDVQTTTGTTTGQATSQVVAAVNDTAAKQHSMAMREESEKASKEVIAERQRQLKFSQINASRFGGIPSGYAPPLGKGGAPAPITDADEQARMQLGNDRANVRRGRGRVPVQSVAGLTTNLEPLLRLAEMGRFTNVFEKFTGKGFNESQGFGQLEPTGPGGLAELNRLRGGTPGVKKYITGQEGKFAAVRPSEAFTRTLIDSLGAGGDNASIEAIRAFTETPEVADSIKKALARGSAPLRGTSGATKRGIGAPKIGEGASDLGAEAKRLFEYIDYLDGQIKVFGDTLSNTNDSIEQLAGTGQPTKGLEAQARDLAKQLQVYRRRRGEAKESQAALGATGTSQEVQLMRAAAVARGASVGGSNDVISQQVGKTAEERAYNEGTGIFGSVKTGQRQAAMAAAGELPSQQAIVNALVNRYFSNQERPEGRTGYSTLKQAAFGPTGRARNGDESGLYGELAGQLPPDLGRQAQKEAKQYLRDTLSAVISDQGFKRSLAEESIRGKESMARPVGRTRTTEFATANFGDLVDPATGSFRTNVTGEGLYRGFAPGAQGRVMGQIARNRKIKAGELAAPPEGSEYPYADPDQMQAELEAIQAKFATSAAGQSDRERARAKTTGKGKYVPGDVGRDIARDTGVFMEEEVRHAPFEKFNEAYGQPMGPGYERIAASLGQARQSGAAAGGFAGGGGQGGGGIGGGGFGEVSGPVHVIVDNVPLRVAFEGGAPGGRAPRGRVTAEGGDEQPEQPADERSANIAGVPKAGSQVNVLGRQLASAMATVQGEPDAMAKYGYRQEQREQKYLSGANPSAVEKEFLAALQAANKPQGTKRGIIGIPSQDRAIEEARRAGVDLNLNDPRGVSGLLTSPPSETVLRANAARSRAQRSLPQRAIGTSVIQIAENLFGGLEGPQQRLATLANRTQDVNRLSDTYTRQREGRRALFSERRQLLAGATAIEAAGGDASQTRARAAGLGVELLALTKQSKLTGAALKEGATEVEQLAKSAVTGSDILRNLAAGAVGGVAGGLATGVIAQAIGGVTQVAQQVLGPIGERLSGFGATTGRVQGGLAQDFRASNDDLAATLAQTGITARLSDDQLAIIAGPLGQRTQTVAGTQALQSQFDLFRTAQNVGGNRFDRALTRPTGGLFDINDPHAVNPFHDISIGGQASTAEVLAEQIRALPSQRDIAKETNPSIADNLRDLTGIGIGDSLATRQANDKAAADKLQDENNTQLKLLNDNLKGSRFQFVASADAAALRKQEDQFRAQGAGSLGEALKDKGIQVTGTEGGGTDVQEFLKRFVEGPQLEPKQLLALDARSIQAQKSIEDLQRSFQLQTVNPQTFAIGEAAAPLQPAAAGINTTGLSAKEARAVNTELAKTQKLYDGINADVATGLAQAKDFVSGTLGSQAGQEFGKSLDHVAAIGKEISGIQIGVETKQAAYQAAQFTYQINLANRSLKDAKGLTGEITKQNGDNLGVLERQTFELQRQSQALGLAQSQKQINFQRAIAGFQSPGLTSEEREARMQEAKLEADYAQKQLDIQKKLFGLGGQGFKIQGSRQVRDLTQQLDLLERGRTLTVETATAEKRIIALTKIQAKENKQVETFYQAAVQRTTDVQTEIGKLVAATGDAMADVGALVLKQFAVTYKGFIDVVSGTAPSNFSGDPNDPRAGKAQGFLGSVSGSTSLGKLGVVGESAGEAVAIVKNPQQLVSPMGGGSTAPVIMVNIYNPVVKSDEDRRKLITDVKRALQTEAKLLLPQRA